MRRGSENFAERWGFDRDLPTERSVELPEYFRRVGAVGSRQFVAAVRGSAAAAVVPLRRLGRSRPRSKRDELFAGWRFLEPRPLSVGRTRCPTPPPSAEGLLAWWWSAVKPHERGRSSSARWSNPRLVGPFRKSRPVEIVAGVARARRSVERRRQRRRRSSRPNRSWPRRRSENWRTSVVRLIVRIQPIAKEDELPVMSKWNKNDFMKQERFYETATGHEPTKCGPRSARMCVALKIHRKYHLWCFKDF